jgi:hypothetical protein
MSTDPLEFGPATLATDGSNLLAGAHIGRYGAVSKRRIPGLPLKSAVMSLQGYLLLEVGPMPYLLKPPCNFTLPAVEAEMALAEPAMHTAGARQSQRYSVS